MANFVTEDYSDISIEDLEDWNDLHPNEDEIGVSATEIPAFVGDNDEPRLVSPHGSYQQQASSSCGSSSVASSSTRRQLVSAEICSPMYSILHMCVAIK